MYTGGPKELTEAALEIANEKLQMVIEEPDWIFNFLGKHILTRGTLEMPKKGAINFHPAPADFPGVGGTSYALYQGRKTYGCVAHFMTEEIDAGPIIRSKSFPIYVWDTCESLFARAEGMCLILFKEIVDDIAKGKVLKPNGEKWARRAYTRAEFDEFLNIDRYAPDHEIQRKVKSCWHSKFPGPYINSGGYKFELIHGK